MEFNPKFSKTIKKHHLSSLGKEVPAELCGQGGAAPKYAFFGQQHNPNNIKNDMILLLGYVHRDDMRAPYLTAYIGISDS